MALPGDFDHPGLPKLDEKQRVDQIPEPNDFDEESRALQFLEDKAPD